jgi:polysaccharide biosynthesis transport protein
MEPAKNQQPQQPQQTPRDTSLHFLDYWRIIRIRKTVIILVFLLVAITATLVTFMLPEMYSSMARIEINPDMSDIPNMTGSMPTSYGYDPYFIQTEFEIMQSEKVLGRVIQALDLNDAWGKKYNNNVPLKTEDTMEILKSRMTLSPERNTKLIDITIYSEDAGEAAQLANSIADAYQQYRIDLRNTNTLNGIAVLEQEYQAEQDKIETVQSNVDDLRKELGVVDVDPNSIAPTPTLTQQQMQKFKDEQIEEEKTYTKESVQLEELQALQATNSTELQDVLPTVEQDSALLDLLSKLRSTEQSLAALKVDYSTNLPDLMRLQKLADELNQEIDARMDGIMAGLSSQVNSEKASLGVLNNFLDTSILNDQKEFERDQPYWEMKRDLANRLEFHKLLGTKIASEKLNLEIPSSKMVTIVDEAKPGKSPVKPNKPLNIGLGVMIGLLVGIGLAFFIEYLDTSVKTIDDVERAFQVPVLGVIPQNVGVLINEGVEGQHAEAYRVLRTNLLFTRKDERLNSLVVVSAGAGEGKSTTVLNLATVIAQSGQRVVVVDSDLRRPTLHKLLKLSNSIGLTNYLLKQNTLEEVIQRTSIPTLDFMASGKLPSSSMNILGSAQMKDMVTELKQRYEFVLFDSPPIMGVSDAAVLASETDMVIQVIQYRRYPQPMNIRAKLLIEKVGGNLVGIILNNINMSQDESYYYYYYGGDYHGYYYSKNDEDEKGAQASKKAPESNADQPGIKT